MHLQQVEPIIRVEKPFQFEVKEAFEFRKDKPFRNIQRVCLWILRKIGAFYRNTGCTVETHVIDGDTFVERIFAQCDELQRHFNRRPSRLIIGAEDYAELMNETCANAPFSFDLRYNHWTAGAERPTYCGLTVEVVPWMRGFVVLGGDHA